MIHNVQVKQEINQEEVIVAIATTVGVGALAIVRLSGKDAIEIVSKVLYKKNGQTLSLYHVPTHTAHHGYVVKPDGSLIDEVMVLVYRMPRSYTGEDSVEINCHGGALVTEEILRTLIEAGCRLAEPGEFTKRAFLNGKIDLTQAEAVGELIHAKTYAMHRSAMVHLKGTLSKRLQQLRSELIRACALLELEFDFSEEDVEFQSRDDLRQMLDKFIQELEQLVSSFEFSKVIREGIKVTIIGKPNAGKSTLLNALIGKERALVSAEAGTTRDYLQEPFYYGGVLFQIVDTAGLRESDNIIEQEGIRRSKEQSADAQIIIYLFDLTHHLNIQELNKIKPDLEKLYPEAKVLFVGNKLDLLKPPIVQDVPAILISAEKNIGLDCLLSELKHLAENSQARTEGSLMVTNVRHYEALSNAMSALKEANTLLSQNGNMELTASSLRAAVYEVGTITGEVTNNDILNYIFEKFCIGK